MRLNGREQILEENLTANDIEKRLIRYGEQVHVRPKSLSLSRSSQPLNKISSSSSSRLSPTTAASASNTNSSNTNNPSGSNLSLNI